MELPQNYQRVIIEKVSPMVDGGRFPAKAIIGDTIYVEADIYADGHDTLLARLLYRRAADKSWAETPMRQLVNDRWQGSFIANTTGVFLFTITAWVDNFQTWRDDLEKRVDAKQKDLEVQLITGTTLITEAHQRASGSDVKTMTGWIETLTSSNGTQNKKTSLALSCEISALMEKYPDRKSAVTYAQELALMVEREKAGFSTWYEMFPRSTSTEEGKHGTFKDCETRLPYIAEMGFDVLYLPPIHPIGHTDRKGKNNTVTAEPGDPGTPWAIGSEEGGHKSIHPELGNMKDFHHLIAKAGEHGIEIALDIAFQCSPDHPWVKEHPEWFLWRPDGTVQYAENPPKKYQDIYPLNFNNNNWKGLWEELKSIVVYWAEQGVRIFRVDNPHTKPFSFWEWLLSEVKKDFPDTIFLAEAFTRPKVMYRLAELGFTQSYTYFTWRNQNHEITEYLNELTKTGVKDFFRPNFWPNTPDILHEYLQHGGRPAFMARLVLAATLSSNYGIYGPVFELMENRPRESGSEEYWNSEKYEIKNWDIGRSDSLKDFIGRVNHIRRENPSLRSNRNLWFNATDNDQIICYSKHTDDLSNIIFTVVNLDSHNTQAGTVNVPLQALGLDPQQSFQVYDLLSDNLYLWSREWNPVELIPSVCPAHVFRIVDSATLPRIEI